MSVIVIKLFLMFLIIFKILGKGELFFDVNNLLVLINYFFFYKYLINIENNKCF